VDEHACGVSARQAESLGAGARRVADVTIDPAGGAQADHTAAIHTLLGLCDTPEPGYWHVDVHDGIQTGSGALHGGSAFGSIIEAVAATANRPVVWATAQFVAHAPPGALLDLWVIEVAIGHRVTQARARLEHDGHEVLTAMAACGTRSFDMERTWFRPLDVAKPEDCPRRAGHREALIDLWQSRVAAGRSFDELDGQPGPGRSASWYKIPGGPCPVTAGHLAVLGDFTVLELHDAFGSALSGNSLDNTLRVATLGSSEWILVDTQVSMLARGFAAVTAHLWSDTGVLLGVASQTLVVRHVDHDGLPVRTDKRFAGPARPRDDDRR
jgi:acyl-CoA thioesterase-2